MPLAPALVQPIQLYAYVVGQHPLAAANHDRHDEQLNLVDEPGPNRAWGEGRTTHRRHRARARHRVRPRLAVRGPDVGDAGLESGCWRLAPADSRDASGSALLSRPRSPPPSAASRPANSIT